MRQRCYVCALAILLAGLIAGSAFAEAPAAASQQKKPAAASAAAGKPTIAVFQLKGSLSELPAEETLPIFSAPGTSLRELAAKMKKAAEDESVKAVVILDEGGTLGSAQLEELRQMMKKLRDAGKDVYVHADSLTMGKYVLCSGATRLSVVPTADLWVNGIYSEQPYVRGLLDKIGVKPDFLTCGAYKSAAELFMREGPSPQADEMMNWLFDSLYSTFVDLVARGRGVDADKVREWIDNGPYTAEKAKAAGLIDAVESREQFQALLKEKYGKDVQFVRKYGQKEQPTVDLSSPFGILKLWADLIAGSQKPKSNKDAVGIVYVDGAIMLGSKTASPFGGAGGALSSDIRKALEQAADDQKVKAVVLRVDSPGGSATASEIILDATKRVKAKKPLVVSMGNVAGSGGYYVSCGADTIFADQSTITGSIGVVSGKLVTTAMWKKVGITFKPYQRGQFAGMLSSSEVFTPEQRQRMQNWMDDIYAVFKNHVSEIRGNKLKKPLEDIAGGRVYTGQQALELGLVDRIGTLQDAIAFAADQAKVSDYDIRVVPEPKSFFERLIEEAGGGKDDPAKLAAGGSLWEMALPYLQSLDPQRMGLIRTAMEQLQILRDEGVVLMCPPVALPQ